MQLVKLTYISKVISPFNELSDFSSNTKEHIGYMLELPKIDFRFELVPIGLEYGKRGISTSLVQQVNNDNTFHTKNSIYHYEIINN